MAKSSPPSLTPVSPEKPKHHSDIMNPRSPKTTHATVTSMMRTDPSGIFSSDFNPPPVIDELGALPSAFVEAGGGLGIATSGILPTSGLGRFPASAGLEGCIILCRGISSALPELPPRSSFLREAALLLPIPHLLTYDR